MSYLFYKIRRAYRNLFYRKNIDVFYPFYCKNKIFTIKRRFMIKFIYLRSTLMKNSKILVLLPAFLFTLIGCGSTADNRDPWDDTSDEYYSLVQRRNKFDKHSDLSFDDEITNGLDDAVWNTLDGYWENGGTTPHNGVRRRNIFYTKDSTGNGYVALKARGLYNLEDPANAGKPEGSCIETKNSLGPGRYEVQMAAMPREGGVTALWTYKCEITEEAIQNEIDLEIGGGGQYKNMWCTTWTRKTNKATKSPNVSDICYMNDGKIHKYTFDWYTEYGEDREPRIDWFVDEHLVQTITGGTITDIDMPLWLGVWMPSWAGEAAWVEDYILVDRVTYKAFDENQYYISKRAYNTYSPKAPSQSDIRTIEFSKVTNGLNKLSNPSFEITEDYYPYGTTSKEVPSYDNYGWRKFDPDTYTSTSEFVNDASEGSKALKVTTGNTGDYKSYGYYHQRVTCSYEGYKYHVSVDAKLVNSTDRAEITIMQLDRAGIATIKETNLAIDSTSYKTYEADITMEANAEILDVFLCVLDGSAIFDNAKVFRVQ